LFAVIAENDESPWADETGTLYHFPKRYKPILRPGAQVIYYKGKMRNASFASRRLTAEPHYFGIASIGSVHADRQSNKGDLFATIENYQPFGIAVAMKDALGAYYERIPANRIANYWRDGVRAIDEAVYNTVAAAAHVRPDPANNVKAPPPDALPSDDFESGQEGDPTLRYVTTYERDPRYRRQALAIHGYRCAACDLSLGERYGPYADGLIHVHHVQPVSTYATPRRINPAIDLIPLCPNCHAVIHRGKTKTLTVDELRAMLVCAG